MNIQPMEKLMLVDFEGDSLYETIELQVFDDIRGKGAAVILYGKNGKNDFFCTDSAFANRTLFNGHICENKGIIYSLNVTNSGLNAYVSLKDNLGRDIEVKVIENNNNDVPRSFLAPIGGVIKNFTFLPMFYMENFNFVKRSGTTLSVKIDNKNFKPKKIPILMNGSFVYLARYSNKPVICCINDRFEGELEPLIPSQEQYLKDGNYTYDLKNNNGHFEINKLNYTDSNSYASVSFSPAIPDIYNLKDNVKISGNFSIEVDSITGIIAGKYQLEKTGENIEMSMNPLKAYSPMTGPLWVLSYKWTANISKNSDTTLLMKSHWDINNNK
jgi:hypothetical protein